MSDLERCLKDFLQSYLPHQRGLSPLTIKSYRDAFKLLVDYVRTQRRGSDLLTIKDLDAKTILAFLHDLEDQAGRGNGIRTRNQRLAAIQSFFKYVSLHVPAAEGQAKRVQSIPVKRMWTKPADSLNQHELEILLQQPQTATADGFRDLTLLAFLFNSGARASEAAALSLSSFDFRQRTVKLIGKGNRERTLPLQPDTITLLRWYRERHRRQSASTGFFINQRGARFTRFGIRTIVKKYLRLAGRVCPSIEAKRLSTHSLRHTCASLMLEADVELNLIREWLGHKSVQTTGSVYTHVDLSPQRRLYERFGPPNYVASIVTSISGQSKRPGFSWFQDI